MIKITISELFNYLNDAYNNTDFKPPRSHHVGSPEYYEYKELYRSRRRRLGQIIDAIESWHEVEFIDDRIEEHKKDLLE